MGAVNGALIGVAVALFLGGLATLAKRPPKLDPKSRTIVLEHSWLLKGLGLVAGLGMPLLVLVLVLVIGFKKPSDALAAGGLLLFFGLLGGWLLLESMGVRVLLSEEGIEGRSPWRGTRFIPWDEVKEVKFSQAMSWFVVVGRRRDKVRVSMLLVGTQYFVEAVKEYLDPERYEKAESGFDKVGKFPFG
jgi:hypothetical protein